MANDYMGSLSLSIRASLDWLATHGEHGASEEETWIKWDEWAERREAFFAVLTSWEDEANGTLDNAFEAAFHDLPDLVKNLAKSEFHATMRNTHTKPSESTSKKRSVKQIAKDVLDAANPTKP